MGLLGFQIRPVSGLEIVDLGGLNGLKAVQNQFKDVWCEAPHHFRYGFWFRSEIRLDLKTQQSQYLMLDRDPEIINPRVIKRK